MRTYRCPSPQERCLGTRVECNGGISKSSKSIRIHSSREDAFRCYVRYLLSQGYKPYGINRRDFESPSGSILVLDKMTHFGAELRQGKTAKGKKTKRVVPMKRGGLIV